MATELPPAGPAAGPHSGASDKAPVDESHGAAQPKRFSALNINQRFLQSAKEAAPKAQAPAAATTSAMDDARASHNPRLVTAMPGRGAAGAATAAADTARKEAPKDTPATPRVPWAHVQPVAPRVNISSHDFPTAKEVMEAEKKAEERAAVQAAEEHARQQAANEELERFRGGQLPSSEHWDDMDEESEDELDDVVEFGDGKQYKISEVEEELAKSQPPRPEPRVPAWGPASRAPWRAEPVREPPPARAPPAPAPAPTWGPLAQRHSTLTGKPMPKIEPPAPVMPSKERAAEMAAEQHDEMATAAERARKRREQDEQAREAERERARQKAAQIEEQLREAERAKREARERELEAQRERLRERLRAQQEAREEHARQRLEREKKEREQREQREHEQREQREHEQREQREKRENELREQRRQAKETRQAKEEPASWRRTTPLPSTHAAAVPVPVPAEPATTCEPLPAEEAPVWRQYTVRMPHAPRVARRPSEAAVHAQWPRDPQGLLLSYEPPLDYACVDARTTAVDILFPLRRPRVHLPQRRIEPAAPRAYAPQRPMDEARWLEQLLGHVEQHPSSAIFADEVPSHAGVRPRRKRAPRVKLPNTLTWRRPSLKALRLPYGGLLEDPFASRAPEVPLLDRQSQNTWGATLALPLVSTAQPDPAEHSRLKSMWANSSKDTEPRPKNSLRDIATDDVLPTPLPLSMHELREAPPKLDVLAMPFRPSQPAEPAPWSYPRDLAAPTSAAYYMPMGGYAPRRTGTDADAYVNPCDYSDFVLSDSW